VPYIEIAFLYKACASFGAIKTALRVFSGGDADAHVNLLLPCKMSVVSFDFSGAGLSGGNTCTLGYHEVRNHALIFFTQHKYIHTHTHIHTHTKSYSTYLIDNLDRGAWHEV
jgi:hypothetical protein